MLRAKIRFSFTCTAKAIDKIIIQPILSPFPPSILPLFSRHSIFLDYLCPQITGMKKKTIFVWAALAMAHLNCGILAQTKAVEKAATQKPNIVVILCDDMGYGDLGCYEQPYISTPHIDALAESGARFTQAYAGSPVSAPSRASLMTGQHTGHCEVRGNREYWRDVPQVAYGIHEEPSRVGQHPLSHNHVVITEIMKDAGYATGLFGKWAGGYEGSPSTPEKRGIDEFFGYICQFQAHLYYPNFLHRYSKALGDTATIRIPLEGNIPYPMHGAGYEQRSQYSADMIHQAALEWIDKQNGEQPFFGMLTYTLPHAELAQPSDSILQYYQDIFTNDKNWGGDPWSRYNPVQHTHAQFAAMITRLDCYVGEIVEKLAQKGLLDNTLILFTSDNGPHEEGGADPTFFGRDGQLRGLKRQCHEGGIRIPFIASWSGKIAEGQTVDHQIAFYDLMPTFCDLMGVENYVQRYQKASDDYFDGISFAPTLFGTGKQTIHDHLYWEFEETDQIAVRQGDWKLIVKNGKPELYDLSNDLHEDKNVADAHPDIVARLIDIIYDEHIESPLFKVTLPERIP